MRLVSRIVVGLIAGMLARWMMMPDIAPKGLSPGIDDREYRTVVAA